MIIAIIHESTKIVRDGVGIIKGELWSWLFSDDNLLIEIPVGYEWEGQYNEIIAYFGGKDTIMLNTTILVQISHTIRKFGFAICVICLKGYLFTHTPK